MDGFNLEELLKMREVLLLLKMAYILGLSMYLVFAVVMVRQVEMMVSALNGLLHLPVRLVAWIHLILVVVILILVALA